MNLPPGRIIVLGEEGELFTLAPDGLDRVDLVVTEGHIPQQPIWSPDALRLAWVEVDERGAPSWLITAHADGSARREAPIGGPAFFAAWDPTSSRVAYLAPGGDSGITLGVVDVTSDPQRADVLAGGQPFYFDWGPAGRGVFAHIGETQLTHLDLGASSRPLAEIGGIFRAPQWDAASGHLTYAAWNGDQQSLVEVEVAATGDRAAPRELLRFDGVIAFANSADGQLAYQVQTLETPSPLAGTIAASIPRGEAVPDALVEGLAILDRASGTSLRLTDEPAVAFFWNGDGSKLLYLMLEQSEVGALGRWYVWDEHGTVRLEAFAPSFEFASDYLPFFDQFARAITPWSPDGSQFVYAGTDENGDEGVWLQSADGAIPPIQIADGVFASWSPR